MEEIFFRKKTIACCVKSMYNLRIKLLSILLLTFFAPSALFAQLPAQGTNQMSFGILSSNNGFLVFKHYFKDRIAYRIGLTGGYKYSRSSETDLLSLNPEFSTYSLTKKNVNFGLILGVQKSIALSDKLESYFGTDLIFGGLSHSYKDETIYSNGNYTIFSSSQSLSPFVTLRPFTGINFYLKKNLAIGAEFQLYFISATFNGKSTGKIEDYYQGNSPETSVTTSKNSFNWRTTFNGTGGITLSYFFN